jgi:hypothetical protein
MLWRTPSDRLSAGSRIGFSIERPHLSWRRGGYLGRGCDGILLRDLWVEHRFGGSNGVLRSYEMKHDESLYQSPRGSIPIVLIGCCTIHVVKIHHMHVSHHRTFTTPIFDCCLLLPIEARSIYLIDISIVRQDSILYAILHLSL